MAPEEDRPTDHVHELVELIENDRAEALAAQFAARPAVVEGPAARRPVAIFARLAPVMHDPLVSVHGADLLLATAYGAPGAFIGTGLWCAAAALTHAFMGPLGLVVAFLAGKGTAMTASHRCFILVFAAVARTALTWDVCAALLASQVTAILSPLDAVFYLHSLCLAAAPVHLLPRRPS